MAQFGGGGGGEEQGRTQKGGEGGNCPPDIMIRPLTPCLMHHGHGNVAWILCAVLVMKATSVGDGDMCISALFAGEEGT